MLPCQGKIVAEKYAYLAAVRSSKAARATHEADFIGMFFLVASFAFLGTVNGSFAFNIIVDPQ